MKKQVHSSVLAFNKNSVVELNNQQLQDTDSGITPSFYFVFVGVTLAITS